MKKISFFFLSIIFLFLNSCEKKEKRCIVAFFDISDSTISRRNSYFQEFKTKILPKLKEEDRIIVDVISDNPLGQARFPINLELPFFNFTQNKLIYESELEKIKVNISTTVENMIRPQRIVERTKIFEALQLAIRIFATYEDYDKKILVLFSDMIEDSDIANFERIDWQKITTDELIQKIQTKIKIPEFQGIKVYVVTGVNENNPQRVDRNYNQIKNFWEEYFQKSGAIFNRSVWYGSTMIEFERETKKNQKNFISQMKSLLKKGDK
jgi:hypothetical protein